METNYFLGIDISKEKLDGALTVDGKTFHEIQIKNNPKDIEAFFKNLKAQISSLANLIICAEHTGIYGLPLQTTAVEKNIKICVEPARQIILSMGIQRGKSDKLDARKIASYAYNHREKLVFWRPERECVQELNALLVGRDRLIKARNELRVPVKESRGLVSSSIVKKLEKHSQASIKAIEKDIKQITVAIRRLVKEDPQLREQTKLATSIPGMGEITAWSMIIASGEFRKISEPKKFACYAGIAPFEHQSGSSVRGKTRVSKMGDMNMKRLLHMAAMSAIQYNQELKLYYNRKTDLGKNRMNVLNAVRNKLISRVYACINRKTEYQKNYQYVLA